MSTSAEERLARIEEALKHIDSKLDTALNHQALADSLLDKMKEEIFEMRATFKIHRIFIAVGFAGALAGTGALTKLLGLL